MPSPDDITLNMKCGCTVVWTAKSNYCQGRHHACKEHAGNEKRWKRRDVFMKAAEDRDKILHRFEQDNAAGRCPTCSDWLKRIAGQPLDYCYRCGTFRRPHMLDVPELVKRVRFLHACLVDENRFGEHDHDLWTTIGLYECLAPESERDQFLPDERNSDVVSQQEEK